jgi:RNA polymerase sigma-70 factor (ECF subfamily)
MTDKEHLKTLLYRIAIYNEERAFSEFFDLYHTRLIRFAKLYVSRYDHAEEVVSEVFIKLLRHKEGLHKIEKFEGYLFAMVKNEALNYLRKCHRISRDLPLDDMEDYLTKERTGPHEKLLEKELRNLINEAIDQLPPKRQMVFKLIKDEGLSYKEVADLMDLSVGTVEVHMKLALKDLRQKVKKYLNDPRIDQYKDDNITGSCLLLSLLIQLS